MNRLGFNLYLKTLVTPEDSLLFLETQEGNFYLNTDKKEWLNYAFRDINTPKEAFGTWKITLNDAEIIDTALNSGLFLLVERRKSEHYRKRILFDGYRLYGKSYAIPTFL